PPLSPTLLPYTTLFRSRKRGSTATAGLASAPLVCILGPKGGTGKTVIATNLAVALAEQKERVILVDLDLQFGDLGLALGLSPERSEEHTSELQSQSNLV